MFWGLLEAAQKPLTHHNLLVTRLWGESFHCALVEGLAFTSVLTSFGLLLESMKSLGGHFFNLWSSIAVIVQIQSCCTQPQLSSSATQTRGESLWMDFGFHLWTSPSLSPKWNARDKLPLESSTLGVFRRSNLEVLSAISAAGKGWLERNCVGGVGRPGGIMGFLRRV